MKKFAKKLLIVALALIMCSSTFVGCKSKGSETGENVLNIVYHFGEYREKWARKMAEAFEKENPGVDVKYESSTSIAADSKRFLEKGSKYDIIFSHGMEWESYAKRGWLEPLDDLYASEVTAGVTVKDRVLDQFLPSSKYSGPNSTEQHYYKMHWTNGVGGIVYNKLLFEKNGWAVPTTYEELDALCKLIIASEIPAPGNRDEIIRPFVFSEEHYYWDYLVFDWMVQLCGKDALDEMLKLESPEVFNPKTSKVAQAQRDALKAWNNLVAINTGKPTDNAMANCIGKKYTLAQADFINGNAAMMPNAQWLEFGMLDNIDDTKCVMAMMPAPFLPNAQVDKDGNPIRYSRSIGGDDSILIPQKAPNKTLAKKFLKFMCREDIAMDFSKNTHGVMLGLKYDNEKLQAVEGNTPFMNSVYEINSNSVKYNTYSSSKIRLAGKMKCEWFTENGFAPYPTLLSKVTKDTDIDVMYENYYAYAKTNWTSWGGK